MSNCLRRLVVFASTCGLMTILTVTVSGSEPPRPDRPAQADEWGYRPAEGASVPLNPPSLTWVHEPLARSYSVQWSRHDDFRNPVTVAEIPWPTYTHHEPLRPGAYRWRYRVHDGQGQVSPWSQARRFTVTSDAVEFPMPTKAQQRQRVPQGHPRLFLRPEDVPRLRDAVRTQPKARSAFEALRAEADRVLAAGPTPEPEHLGSARDKDNVELVKYWWPNREQTMRACQEAELIAFVALISGEDRYRQAARRWVLHLAAWNPDGPTNFRLNCEAAKPLLYRLPRAYDWAHDTLTEPERERVRQVLRRRIGDAWESGEVQRGVGHLSRPYNSHGNRVWHKIGEAGIALLGEVPEAEVWLDYAINKFYACYPVWSDEDGGWHEGVGYWAGYMGKAVWWLQVARAALGIDGMRKPFFAQVGDYPLYVAPPGSPNMGFGDQSYRTPSSGWGGFLDYFLRAGGDRTTDSRAPYWRWWAERWGMEGESGWLGFLYDMTLPPPPEAKPPTDLPSSKVFHGIGVASLHTSLLDGDNDIHVLFKSSPFGSRSHGHNPQNSFQLNAFGVPLLTTCVYRDLHGSRFHYGWAHSTIAHNALLFDGQGQEKHFAAPQGRIVSERLTPALDYVAGDATAAYNGRVARYVRHVAFVKDTSTPFLVLFDDVEAPESRSAQFLLHALSPFQIDSPEAMLTTHQPSAGVQVRYLASGPLAFRQWDGYDPPPTREFPNQWHVEASIPLTGPRLETLTVLVPFRGEEPPKWRATRLDSEDAVGVRVEVGGQTVSVALRRHGVTGPASWQGRGFDGPILVQLQP